MTAGRSIHDVVIIGGGPAGIGAAVVLGRCLRSVMVIDAGKGRNRHTRVMHGFLTREGISPARFLRIAKAQTGPYDITWHSGEALAVDRIPQGFRVKLKHGAAMEARKVLLATGVVDSVPEHPGAGACYGKSLFHCPYCDGWEVRGSDLAVLAHGGPGARYALEVSTWGRSVVLCTDGPSRLGAKERSRMERRGIAVETRRIASMEHDRGMLRELRFTKGPPLSVQAAFFNSRIEQHCGLAAQLGCQTQHQGIVFTDRKQRTGVPGLFVAGDASVGTHFVSVAAAEGAKAGVAINTELIEEDMEAEDRSGRRTK
jgi:thioredoxin reductase